MLPLLESTDWQIKSGVEENKDAKAHGRKRRTCHIHTWPRSSCTRGSVDGDVHGRATARNGVGRSMEEEPPAGRISLAPSLYFSFQLRLTTIGPSVSCHCHPCFALRLYQCPSDWYVLLYILPCRASDATRTDKVH